MEMTFNFVLSICMGLLMLTYISSFFDLGFWGLLLSMALSTAKATFIALYFMELKKGEALHRHVPLATGLWIVILIVLVLADYLTRS